MNGAIRAFCSFSILTFVFFSVDFCCREKQLPGIGWTCLR